MKSQVLGLIALCAGVLVYSQTLRNCEGGFFLDPTNNNKAFLCLDQAKKNPRIINGYAIEKVLALMIDREDNAWHQLSAISELRERLSYSMALAFKGQAEYEKSPRVHDITTVDISKTIDGGTFVLRLRTDSGKAVSLWLDGGDIRKSLRVRSVSTY